MRGLRGGLIPTLNPRKPCVSSKHPQLSWIERRPPKAKAFLFYRVMLAAGSKPSNVRNALRCTAHAAAGSMMGNIRASVSEASAPGNEPMVVVGNEGT